RELLRIDLAYADAEAHELDQLVRRLDLDRERGGRLDHGIAAAAAEGERGGRGDRERASAPRRARARRSGPRPENALPPSRRRPRYSHRGPPRIPWRLPSRARFP